MQLSEKRNVIILFTLFLILAAAAIYFLLAQRVPPVPFYTKNPATGEFEKINTLPADSTILDLNLSTPNQADNFSLTRALKGYFHNYNEGKKTLEIKNEFRNSTNLPLIEVALGAANTFYCWPSEVSGNGRTIPTKSLTFHVEPDGRDIVMPGERQFSLDLLPSMLRPDQYLVVQLQDAFNLNTTNLVQKLIVLGC